VKELTGFSWFRIDCEGTDWVQLVQDRFQWWFLVKNNVSSVFTNFLTS